ncbi:unnamed protein product [Boreogadus saida]
MDVRMHTHTHSDRRKAPLEGEPGRFFELLWSDRRREEDRDTLPPGIIFLNPLDCESFPGLHPGVSRGCTPAMPLGKGAEQAWPTGTLSSGTTALTNVLPMCVW